MPPGDVLLGNWLRAWLAELCTIEEFEVAVGRILKRYPEARY